VLIAINRITRAGGVFASVQEGLEALRVQGVSGVGAAGFEPATSRV
jgi:hypothetical protein